MNAKLLSWITSRTIVLIILGTILGVGFHFQTERRRQAGRDTFLAEQEKRWDRYYTSEHHLPLQIIPCVFGVGLVAGVYELLAAGIYPLIRKVAPDEPKPML